MLQVFTSSRSLAHRVPQGFPERPERLERILERLDREGIGTLEAQPSEAARAAAARLHDAAYLERFRRATERGDGLLDSADNPLSAGTWEAAWGAVDAAVAAVTWALEGAGRRAFVAVRPPGHHAERDTAMGFCYLGTAALAADHLVRDLGRERVAIFDFDVHHGNGTQHLLEERGDVFYGSVHQWPFYPGTGAAHERGVGAGRGATLNVPLPAGSDDAAYDRAFDETILPALETFAPEVLILSAGFDAWRSDPLGGMRVSRAGFESWGRKLAGFADAGCDGRIVALLEGGYDLAVLGDLVVAHLTGLESA